jgi:hypothetical protein
MANEGRRDHWGANGKWEYGDSGPWAPEPGGHESKIAPRSACAWSPDTKAACDGAPWRTKHHEIRGVAMKLLPVHGSLHHGGAKASLPAGSGRRAVTLKPAVGSGSNVGGNGHANRDPQRSRSPMNRVLPSERRRSPLRRSSSKKSRSPVHRAPRSEQEESGKTRRRRRKRRHERVNTNTSSADQERASTTTVSPDDWPEHSPVR